MCPVGEHVGEHMEQVSVRLPEAMKERLEREAGEAEKGLAEHIRSELREGSDLRERVDDLEQRLADVEEELERREVARPVSRKDSEEIVDELEAEDVDADQAGAVDDDQDRLEIEVDSPETPDLENSELAVAGDTSSMIYEALEGWPGKGATNRERRREVGARAVRWLRDRGEPASASDFQDALFDGYPVPGQKPETWWRKTVRPALQECVDAGLVEYREGHHDYRWNPPE